ncbi:cupin domain-containing protein [Parasedimentitalea huanghaiensis]|uniref:Cupin n=1 Tax=Parasedimentitalea huanghaiensis TaxID=2682100 RepID=A0A6L6WJQ8_9RHOB|nr:cupin domain-containing protein [Zongyanglinia huanghaiensis]MVO17591.1 cupin [Zongyanglinia huanghaiensis]
MTTSPITDRIVRYGDLQPCKTAFIDAHTPGSDQKENFTIIGGGVSESPDQHVHLSDKIGFNIGAAGQPPKCRNSLHTHTTAEVFFVLKGRWRFFWGRYGTAGEFVAEEGDIFNIPTGIFRGFENIGTDYGMIMAVLGGDDAGGGVTWAPQVIEDAQAHGLILGENGVLYDSKKGDALPHNVNPMPLLTKEQLKDIPEVPAEDVIPGYVARYWDLMALAGKKPAKVIGPDALLKDRPGFEIDFLTRGSIADEMITADQHTVLMPMRGHWKLRWDGGESVINPGDTSLINPGESYALTPSMTGESSLYRITATDDPAGATWLG